MSKVRATPYARSASAGRLIARSAITGRFVTVSTLERLEKIKVTPAAVGRALARRQRAAARAETTAAIEAARRGETEKLGDNMRSIMAALDDE